MEEKIDVNLEEIEQKLREAKVRFKELLKVGAGIREKELLEYYHTELPNTKEKEAKIRKQVIQRIQKEKRCNFNFQYMTKHIRKGERRSL